MKLLRGLVLTLIAAALTFGVSPSARAADAPLATINLINLPADNSAEVYYAQELGYFKDVGLDVHITPMTNSGAIIAAIAGGAGDIGNAVVGSVADARSKGIPIIFIAPAGLYDAKSPTAALSVLKDSPIKKASDLTGKVVAVSGLNDLTYFATRAWIDKNGGNSAAVKYIELPFPAMAAAVLQRRVDAAYIIEPFYTVNASRLRILARAAESVAPRYQATGWIANESWLASHADLALRFASAIHRTALWANSHQKESAAILLKYLKIDPAIVDKMRRVTYAVTLDTRLVQPPIDTAAKYTGQTPVSANSLIWAPGK
ncbi:MAG TPA: ABC transporter substrate-binding protein [Candidatus Lustribacter sp.]